MQQLHVTDWILSSTKQYCYHMFDVMSKDMALAWVHLIKRGSSISSSWPLLLYNKTDPVVIPAMNDSQR
jgi:hypothetical protein